MSFTPYMEKQARKLADLANGTLNGYTITAASSKEAYLRTGRGLLRAVAKHYGMTEYKASINRAGMAVSGDITLIGMFPNRSGIYIHMSEPRFYATHQEPTFYFRSVSHIGDCHGGRNQWMTYNRLADNLELACGEMKRCTM